MIIGITLKKIHCSIFEYLHDKSYFSIPLKSMVIRILLKIGMVELLKNLQIG